MDDPEFENKADNLFGDAPIRSPCLKISGNVSRRVYPEASAIGPLQAFPNMPSLQYEACWRRKSSRFWWAY